MPFAAPVYILLRRNAGSFLLKQRSYFVSGLSGHGIMDDWLLFVHGKVRDWAPFLRRGYTCCRQAAGGRLMRFDTSTLAAQAFLCLRKQRAQVSPLTYTHQPSENGKTMRWHTRCPAHFGFRIHVECVSTLSDRRLSVPTDELTMMSTTSVEGRMEQRLTGELPLRGLRRNSENLSIASHRTTSSIYVTLEGPSAGDGEGGEESELRGELSFCARHSIMPRLPSNQTSSRCF